MSVYVYFERLDCTVFEQCVTLFTLHLIYILGSKFGHQLYTEECEKVLPDTWLGLVETVHQSETCAERTPDRGGAKRSRGKCTNYKPMPYSLIIYISVSYAAM